jgi:hypothetical protein
MSSAGSESCARLHLKRSIKRHRTWQPRTTQYQAVCICSEEHGVRTAQIDRVFSSIRKQPSRPEEIRSTQEKHEKIRNQVIYFYRSTSRNWDGLDHCQAAQIWPYAVPACCATDQARISYKATACQLAYDTKPTTLSVLECPPYLLAEATTALTLSSAALAFACAMAKTPD